MIDIGANLTHKSFRRDLAAVLDRAQSAGVASIVVTGTSLAASRAAWELAEETKRESPVLFSTAGVHPHQASSWSPDASIEIRALAARPEVVAIGECGLDFDRNFSPPDAQIRAFEEQIAIAADLRLPLFLHERSAHDAFVSILARERKSFTRAVVHCFTGPAETLTRYLELDLHIGITGWICDERRGAHLRAIVAQIPADRLMIETDAPFLLPRDMPRSARPSDGRNEPCLLPHVLRAVAAARNESAEETERATDATARAFFSRDRKEGSAHSTGRATTSSASIAG